MEIFIGKDSGKEGPFTPFQIREMLEEGEIEPETLGWIRDEVEDWKPLNEIPSMRRVIDELAQARLDEDLATREGPTPPLPPPLPAGDPRSAFRHAISRFFARWFDLFLFQTLALFVCRGWREPAATPEIMMQRFNQDATEITMIFFVSALIWQALEAVLLSTIGTTPGKALMNLRVRLSNDKKMGLNTSTLRSFFAFALGMGLMISILPIITGILSFMRMQNRGITVWDEQLRVQVTQTPVDLLKRFVMIFGFLALLTIFPRAI
ncbi:MAG: hypothetical protein ACI8UO_000215 [Verrucomicrobiales bacterium]|jgi:hypothetical protein